MVRNTDSERQNGILYSPSLQSKGKSTVFRKYYQDNIRLYFLISRV